MNVVTIKHLIEIHIQYNKNSNQNEDLPKSLQLGVTHLRRTYLLNLSVRGKIILKQFYKELGQIKEKNKQQEIMKKIWWLESLHLSMSWNTKQIRKTNNEENENKKWSKQIKENMKWWPWITNIDHGYKYLTYHAYFYVYM